MCTPMSAVLTKENAYWSKVTESHTDIIEEHKLRETFGGKVQLLCAEITPPKGADGLPDYTAPFEQWTYRVDEAFPRPAWADDERDAARLRLIIPAWRKARIILPNEERDVLAGEVICANRGTVSANSGTVSENWGTVSANSGTVSANRGTVSENWGTAIRYGGTITNVDGGAVIVDRSGDTVVCIVGIRKAKKARKAKK